MSYKRKQPVTIPASGTTSNYVKLEDFDIVGIYAPAALVGTAYSFMTKHEEADTPVAVNGITLTHADGKYLPLPEASQLALLGCRWIAVVSNDTETSAVEIGLALRSLA